MWARAILHSRRIVSTRDLCRPLLLARWLLIQIFRIRSSMYVIWLLVNLKLWFGRITSLLVFRFTDGLRQGQGGVRGAGVSGSLPMEQWACQCGVSVTGPENHWNRLMNAFVFKPTLNSSQLICNHTPHTGSNSVCFLDLDLQFVTHSARLLAWSKNVRAFHLAEKPTKITILW